MDSFRVTVLVEKNGQRVDELSVVKRVEIPEYQSFNYDRASAEGFIALPTGQIAEIQLLVVRVDQPVTLRLNGQSDAGIDLVAGGYVLIVGADIDVASATNVMMETNSGQTTRVVGIGAGIGA